MDSARLIAEKCWHPAATREAACQAPVTKKPAKRPMTHAATKEGTK